MHNSCCCRQCALLIILLAGWLPSWPGLANFVTALWNCSTAICGSLLAFLGFSFSCTDCLLVSMCAYVCLCVCCEFLANVCHFILSPLFLSTVFLLLVLSVFFSVISKMFRNFLNAIFVFSFVIFTFLPAFDVYNFFVCPFSNPKIFRFNYGAFDSTKDTLCIQNHCLKIYKKMSLEFFFFPIFFFL